MAVDNKTKDKTTKKRLTEKQRKIFSKIFLGLGILYAVMAIPSFFGSVQAGLSFLIVAAILIFVSFKIKKPAPEKVEAAKKSEIEVLYGELNYNLFVDIVDNNVLRYEYEKELFLNPNAVNIIAGNGGKYLKFEKEPDNPYDEKAVAVYLDEIAIGYVYKGRIQDMINDWISRNDFFIGYINKYSVVNNKATYKIGFYKPLDNYDSEVFSIVKTSKKLDDGITRMDNLWCCNPDDVLEIEFDTETESYILYNESMEEVGELPKRFNRIADDFCKMVAFLNTCDYDDDKIKATVSIYFIN